VVGGWQVSHKSRMTLAVSNAHAAIAERLNGPVEISGIEKKSITAAQNALCKTGAMPAEY
jgi:hypothetical protein